MSGDTTNIVQSIKADIQGILDNTIKIKNRFFNRSASFKQLTKQEYFAIRILPTIIQSGAPLTADQAVKVSFYYAKLMEEEGNK